MNIVPIGINILVRPFEPTKKTSAGLIIPDSAQERPSMATVVAVGEGLKDRPMVIQPEDIVYHVKNCGTPIACETEILYFMKDVDVLARITKETTNGKSKAAVD